ncbi:hypothetical protein K7B10_02055 [Streptomyces flavotricini]|uniref:Uncharacterized protein n=2 Tax=Streptomyces flavotricini TaxID=66888 RepID=A0ABS8DYU7_9ACTN|nr:hypothetical protein [Streptomyces flavotricini]
MATWRIGSTTIRKVLEWDHWAGEADVDLRDTMRPLIDRGLVDFVATDHHVCDGVRLEAAPGHTPSPAGIRRAVRDTGTLVIGTHFPAPTAGLLRRGGDGAVRFFADGLR